MSDLRQLIRELIEQELEEVSTSGATPGFQTPNAFRGNSAAGKAKMRKNSNQAGYVMVGDEEDADKLQESRYHEYRDDPSASATQKIGKALSDINKSLKEIDRQLKMNGRLKKESGLETGQLWKRTNQALTKIDGTLQQILHRVRELKG